VTNNTAGARWTDIARGMAMMVIIIGGAVLASWLIGASTSNAFSAEFGVMKASGALLFTLLGIALLALPQEADTRGGTRRKLTFALSALVLGFALVVVLYHLASIELPFGTPSRGSVILFGLSALALLCLASGSPRMHTLGQFAGGGVLFVALVALIAFAFDLSPHRTLPFVSISAQSTLAFMFLGAGALLARPRALPVAVLLGDLPSARLARALIVAVMLILPALGWFWLEGEQRGLYGSELGAALMVASSLALLAVFIWFAASHANEAEAHLDRLRRLYAALSRTNQTITRITDRSELLAGVCRTAVEQGGFRFAWIAWTNPEGTRLEPAAQAAAPPGYIEASVPALKATASDLREMVTAKLAHHDSIFVNDIETDPIASSRRLALAGIGVRAAAIIPIFVAARLVAVMFVYSDQPGVFAREEQELLREMANDVGYALRHLEHDERHEVALAALEHSESRLASILTSLDSGIWSVDPHTHSMIYVNPAFERIFGHPIAELLADPMMRFRDLHPDDRARVAGAYYATLDHSGSATFEYRLCRPDGEVRWIQDRGWVVRESEGIRRYDGIATDITERKRAEDEVRELNATLEKRVTERTVQLENANRELNAFSYSVSHDLRAPLRAIEGFSALLAERISPRLSSEELGFLQRIRRAVERMSGLIDGMLQLARLSTQPLEREDLDLSAIAREVADELHAEAPSRDCDWQIQPGLHVNADPALLRAVMQNLIGNAWKFTGRVDRCRIELGSRDLGSERAIFVRDNGAGFDMAFAERLFDAFHRMHNEQEFPGTGIGLATVKRIVARHGGRIWAESSPGAGATFWFTLGPARPPGNTP
jgi:PAS domain S-box-containing protein